MTEPASSRVDPRPDATRASPPFERAAVVPAAGDATATIDRIWRRHERRRWLRVPAIIAAVGAMMLVAELSARHDPQRVMRLYAPGVRLGTPVGAGAQRRFHLQPATVSPSPLSREFLHGDPPLLVGMSPALETDGLSDVAIAVGDVPANARTPRAPLGAPTSRVALSVPTPDAARRVERRLRDLYGRPEGRCFDEGIRTLFWPGNRHGGALLVTPTRPDPAAYATPYAARLVLGARRWEATYPRATACPRE